MKPILPILIAALLSACTTPAPEVAETPHAMAARNRSGSTLSMDASRWDIRYSINMPSHPTQAGAGWEFWWKVDTSEIDYLTCNHSRSVTAAYLTMTGTVYAAPDTVFDHKTESGNTADGIPSSFRFIIQKDMTSEYGRWFSNPMGVTLKPGPFTLTVKLTPENWSSVYGKMGDYSSAATAGFYKALASPQALGIVFGGGYFFSHGVRVHGSPARLYMNNFKLQ